MFFIRALKTIKTFYFLASNNFLKDSSNGGFATTFSVTIPDISSGGVKSKPAFHMMEIKQNSQVTMQFLLNL